MLKIFDKFKVYFLYELEPVTVKKILGAGQKRIGSATLDALNTRLVISLLLNGIKQRKNNYSHFFSKT